MKYYVFFAICILLLFSCDGQKEEKSFALNGIWEIQQRVDWDGEVLDYDTGDYTWLRVYDDSCFYNCRIVNAPNGTMLIPLHMGSYTIVKKGQADYLYLQDDEKRPLIVESDSVIAIQEYGIKYRWRITDKYDDRLNDIIRIIKGDFENPEEAPCRYVFSNAERQLERSNQTYIYIIICIIIALLLMCYYATVQYRHRKHVERELKQIEEEKRMIPEPVRIAMNDVKEEFQQTDFYIGIRRRIAAGERLGKTDWSEIENQLNRVYPRFTTTLYSLHRMSEIEYQVCLLLKLDVTPSEIANALCKDVSSISTTRSRLYMKVFGKKGSSKDWDEFIHSL